MSHTGRAGRVGVTHADTCGPGGRELRQGRGADPGGAGGKLGGPRGGLLPAARPKTSPWAGFSVPRPRGDSPPEEAGTQTPRGTGRAWVGRPRILGVVFELQSPGLHGTPRAQGCPVPRDAPVPRAAPVCSGIPRVPRDPPVFPGMPPCAQGSPRVPRDPPCAPGCPHAQRCPVPGSMGG